MIPSIKRVVNGPILTIRPKTRPKEHKKGSDEIVGTLDFSVAKELTIDKMHRSNQIVKRCTAFAHP